MTPCFEIPKSTGFRGAILFMIMYRLHNDDPDLDEAIWTPIYKSELKGNSNEGFVFNQFSMMKSDLCHSDNMRNIKIEIFKADKSGNHQCIGNTIFTVSDVQDSPNKKLDVSELKGATFKF